MQFGKFIRSRYWLTAVAFSMLAWVLLILTGIAMMKGQGVELYSQVSGWETFRRYALVPSVSIVPLAVLANASRLGLIVRFALTVSLSVFGSYHMLVLVNSYEPAHLLGHVLFRECGTRVQSLSALVGVVLIASGAVSAIAIGISWLRRQKGKDGTVCV